MESSSGNWATEGQEDCSSVEELTDDDLAPINPLATFAVDLALCLLAIEEHNGGFCDWCSCEFKYHIKTFDWSCELCNCIELHKIPELPFVASAKLPIKKYKRAERETSDFMVRDREKAARFALRELTE